MRRNPERPLIGFLAIIALLATSFFAVPASVFAHNSSAHKLPLQGLVLCGGTLNPSSAFKVVASGGYTGTDQNGKRCSGSYSYATTHTNAQVTWTFNVTISAPPNKSEGVAFEGNMPANLNGRALVDYSLYTCSGSLVSNTTVNQNALSGYISAVDYELVPGASICVGKIVLWSGVRTGGEKMVEDALSLSTFISPATSETPTPTPLS
jgi:hypothetical protein